MSAPSTNRQIRVFVSSTFRDMHAERDLLVKKIFPQLRKLCEERAVTWADVDLRWGITEEEKAEGKVLPLCLAEVERCRPFFIGLLGERYGWSLKPGDVSEALMQAEPWLKEHLEKSVTELEIYHAVLRDSAMADRALFYFRDPGFLNHLPPDANRGDFVCESSANAAKLAELKNVIRKEHAAGRLRFAPRENYSDPEALGESVLADFTEVIGTLFPKPAVPDLLAQEAARHEAYARSRHLAFVGRESMLRRLDEQLLMPGKPLVLTGEAGCGKSALLAEWVYRHREKHPDDLIIQHYIGSTPDSATWQGVVRRILGELKRSFSIPDEIPTQTDQLRNALQDWIGKCSDAGRRVILVLDALNQFADDGAAQQLGWLPVSFPANFCVLISSLESESLGVLRKRGCEIKTVPLFQCEEIIPAVTKFFELYGKRQLPRETLTKIETTKAALNPLYLRAVLDELRQFGRHEELIATANRYLSATDLPQLFDRILDRWHEDFGKEHEYPDLVRRSLCLIACARFGLAETEILDLLGENGERLPRRPWTPFFLAAENALAQRLGLITLGHDYFRNAVKVRWLKDTNVVRAFRQQLIAYFNHQEEWTSRKVEELPWQLAQNQEWDELENALVSEECFDGLQARNPFELLGYWRMMPPDFDLERSYTIAYSRWKRHYTEPILIAELAFRVGMFFRTAGLLEVAEQKHRQALNLAESALGENHPTVGMYLSNLATICVEKSRFQEANGLFNRALSILRNQHGSDSPIVAQAMNNYSCLFMAADQLGDAEQMARESLAVAEKTLPPNDPGMATRLNNLAKILEGSDRFEEAEPLMRRAPEIEEAANGSNHPEVATRLNNLGVLLNHLAKHGEAENLLRRALSIDESVCGLEHPAVAKSLNNLASVLSATNRTPEAMDCLNRALRIEEKASGPNDPAVATTLNNLACLLQNTNHLAEAEPLFRRALEIDKLHFGSVHSKVAQHLNNLATLLKDMKRLGEAEVAIREALSIYEQRFGPNHTTVAVALTNLGQVLHDLNRLTEAEPIMRRALDISERSFGLNHPQVALCLSNLAQLLQDTNRCTEAEPLMRQALKIQSQCFGENHPSVGLSFNNIAGLLRRTGKANEAEPFYQKAIEIFLRFSKANKSNHPFLQKAIDNYTDLLADMGHEPKEIELRLNMITLPLGAHIRFKPYQ